MNFKRKKYLTMEEKRKLALEGKDVPVCVYPDKRAQKTHKKEQKKLADRFSKNI